MNFYKFRKFSPDFFGNRHLCRVEKPRVILGIDPGTNLLGYGLIEIEGKKPKLLGLGVVRLAKVGDAGEKLHHIYERVSALIEGFDVTEVAVEAPFFGKNVQSMLKLGRAQGVAIAAAIGKGLPVFEYVPRKIKQSIAGSGNASKEQVFAMLHAEFQFEEKPETMDATDGLAAAVCHFYQFAPRAFGSTKGGTAGGKNKAGGWAQFLKENPDREV
jgi:crossover junction endodeoxyribonuclease RuvC